MKRLISILFPLAAFVSCLVPLEAHAKPVLIGSVVGSDGVLVCKTKEAAEKLLDEMQAKKDPTGKDCGIGSGVFKVGGVVAVGNVGDNIAKVVAIELPNGTHAFWLTFLDIVAPGQHDI